MRVLRMVRLGVAAVCLFGVGAIHGASAQSAFFGIGHAKDGDSLTVGNREVRLYGIDAPEWDQTCKRDGRDWACGQVASDELSRLVTGKDLSCVAVDTDQYGRTVAQCSAGDTDVNRTMVARGYAVAFRRYSLAYASAEESARVNKRGLWAGTFELPSLYRRQERKEPTLGTSSRGHRRVHTRDGIASVYRGTATRTGGCNIKGNRGSHGGIYHLPGMPYYDRTNPEEWFCTEAQAQAAGYGRSRAR